ncbi:MAG: alpha-1,6-glucosidase domain-containing protein, partial [Candidatus Sericytochromatia bacterium]
AKVPLNSTSNKDKVRIQNLGQSMIALSQGIPFFHAGDEILRSKSGDGDSYDSGDWFNAIDFTYGSNNWGVGLPSEWRNKDEWSFWKERLSMSELKVNKDNILSSLSNFKRFLSIRKSSKLFRLNSSDEIKNQVSFLENETSSGTVASIPGVIAMYVEDKNNIDSNKKSVLSIFNANKTAIEFSNSMIKGKNMELAPQLLDSNVYLQKGSEFVLLPIDPQISKAKFNNQSGTITIPPYTSLVYFEKE